MKHLPHNQEPTLINRSRAYHAHPSNPEDCSTYQEMYKRRCPCQSYNPKGKKGGQSGE